MPAELAAICARALARRREDRFVTADELRVGVEAFLSHASARALSTQARASLDELVALVDSARDDNAAAQRAFSAARFGFEAAQRTWPASPEARAGLGDAQRAMARYEISRRR